MTLVRSESPPRSRAAGGLIVHRAERADRLADALAEVLGEPPADPFAPEIVAVPERGVERWLAQRLAARLGRSAGAGPETHADGVCANVRFPSPGALVAEAVDAAAGVDPLTDPWSPSRVVWPLLAEIDRALAEAGGPAERFAALAAHLGAGGRDRRYAVARRLAELFASYATHRPAMLPAWLAGADAEGPESDAARLPADLRWQAELWRRLRRRIGAPGPAERLAEAVATLRREPGRAELPQRISVFGPTRLAAGHLAVLDALAVHREVHLWIPHPSPVLWSALERAAQQPAPERSGGSSAVRRAADRSAVAVRNPLLRSLGRDVRELQLRLPAGALAVHHPAVPDAAEPDLLHRVQAAIREDRPPGGPLPELDPADRSVAVHACHGPDRQVEVLREVILGLLVADPTLEPRDIIVMCPDIEAFAPLISAAFGLAGEEDRAAHPGHRLRVRLADRALRQANPLLGTVSALLELADARVTASQVLDLVGSAPVRRRFRLDDDALDRIGELVARAGVRWGLDAAHRTPYRLAGFPQNTWAAGLDRMLVGVAMAERPGEQDWLGTALPLDDVDSSDVELVGTLAEFLERLRTTLDALAGPQPLTGWVAALDEGLAALTDTTPAEAWQAAQARAELTEVVRSAGPQAGTVALTLTDVRGLLADRLRGRPSRANFRTGTLTVATLVPMRSVPHRVVCLLGLDDGVFPRSGATDGDDVLARDPRIGERDPRSEDRQLLLDAIVAATERLVVVYSGADERSGARRPPAVPLGELLEAIDATVAVRGADGGKASEQITTRHPLQPFDRRNFEPGRLVPERPFSFDPGSLAGAQAALAGRAPRPPFLAEPLAPVDHGGVIELDDLVRFLEHPVKAFLRQRVGMTAAGTLSTSANGDAEPTDALPVELDPLGRWAVGDRLLRDRLAGADPDRCAQAEWRRGELPPGALGRAVLRTVADDIEPLVNASHDLRIGEPASRDVAAAVPQGRLVGTVAQLHGSAIVAVEYSRLGPKHRLRAWARLLALTATYPEVEWRAITLGRGRGGGAACSTIGPVDPGTAAEVLAGLVALHAEGLRAPLLLPAPCTEAYAKARLAGASAQDAAASAAAKWEPYEQADEAHALVVGAKSPFEAVLAVPNGTGPNRSGPGGSGPGRGEPTRFGELALRIWRPLLAAEQLEVR